MLLTGPSEPPPTAIIPHRMKPHVAPPEPLREATEAVPTVAPVAPAATPPEVSIHKTVGPHPASAGASPPCLPLGYCPALRGTASFPGAGHPREGQQASLLGDKYLLLEALEGSSLHRCLHIQTQEELVCKVTSLSIFLSFPRKKLPFPSFHISFTSSRTGIPFLTLNTVLIPLPPPSSPNQLPQLFPSPSLLVESCGAVCNLLRCCAIASFVIFTPAESISCSTSTRSSWPAGGATSVRTLRSPTPSPATLAQQLFQFFIRFSAESSAAPSTIFWFCLAASPPLRW